MFKNLIIIGLGGFFGSILRYLAWYFLKSPHFPLSTLIVNITGSFLIGIIIGFGMKDPSFPGTWKLFLATGICGGFTTFSSFSVENMEMLIDGKYLLSFFYICTSIILGIASTWLGFKMIIN